MSHIVRYTFGAQEDLMDAYDWYSDIHVNLGEDFLDHIELAENVLSSNPFSFTLVLEQTRKIVIQKYPYCMFYEIHGTIVYVIAISHSGKKPSFRFQPSV